MKDVEGIPAGGFGPDVDHRQVTGGDLVTYRVDLSNRGGEDAGNARIRDLLPAGLGCDRLVAGSISDGGSCVTPGSGPDRIEWDGIDLAAGGSKTLTYTLEVPAGVSPDQKFVNTAGVVEYEYRTNEGESFVLVPDNDTVRDDSLTPNTFPAEDDSDIYTASAAVVKTRTTAVDEAGNGKSSEATIGERIDYTVTATIPKGTTIYGSPTLTDPLGDRQTVVPGSLCDPACTLGGNPLPAGGVTVTESPANTITTAFPASWANTTGHDVKLVLRFSATVRDLDANVRGGKLPNTARLIFEDQLGRTVTHQGSVTTRIVEPAIDAEKTDDLSGGRVRAGQTVGFTVKASARSGSHFSTAHDVTVVDTLPAGTDPVDGTGNPVADGGTVGPQNGIWDATSRTITWTAAGTPALAAIAPGATVALRYDAKVEDPAVAGRTYTNTVAERTSSLAGNVPGERTPASTAPTAGGYSAGASDTIRTALPAITKSVTPDPVTNGNRVSWKLKLTVPSDLISYDTTVTDTVPDEFAVDGYGPVSCVSGCPAGDPQIVTWPPAIQADGSTVAAWYLGDLAASGQDRTYEIALEGHLLDSYRGGGHVASGDSLTNEASVFTNRSNRINGTPATPPGGFDDRSGPAKATSHVVEPQLTIDKSVNAGPRVSAGDRLTYTIKLRNTGTSPAFDLVVNDRPDVELVNVQAAQGAAWLTDGWTAADPGMSWTVPGPVAPGQTVTLTYTAEVTMDLDAADTIDNTAAIGEYFGVPKDTRNSEPNPDYHRYTGPDDSVRLKPVPPALAIVKTPDDGEAVAGTGSAFTIEVTNTGGSTAHGVIVDDDLPNGLTYTPGTATASPAAGFSELAPLSWKLERMKAGATVTINLPVRVSPDVPDGTRLVNLATTWATDVPDRKSDEGSLKVKTRADVAIEKTVGQRHYEGGDKVIYTLVATNRGPSTARDVRVHDELPAEVDFVSVTPGPPVCAEAAGVIDCDFGSLQPGATRTVKIVTRAKGAPPVSGPGHHSHQITVSKEEAYLSIPAGQTVTRTLTCANQGEVSDGSFRLLAVDQGESLGDVRVKEMASTGPDRYRFTVENATGGQAQVKIFTVCLPPRTDSGEDHSHTLLQGAPVTVSPSGLQAGRHSFHLSAPLGYRAVAPGIAVTAGEARLVKSEDDGSGGWNFTVEVTSPSADLTLSVRPLREVTGTTRDHSHDLVFTHPVERVTVQPGQRVTARVSCPVGYKGITATWDLPPGLILLGDEPEPVNRDFDLVNPTDRPIEATLDLLCLGIRTGTEIDELGPVINTAWVGTTTTDPDRSNNSSSAGTTISRQQGSADPKPARITFRSKALSAGRSGASIAVPLRCAGGGACAGRIVLSARVPRRWRRGRRNAVIGKRRFRIGPKTRAVRVGVKPRFRHLIRNGKVRRIRIRVGHRSTTRRVHRPGARRHHRRS